MTLDSPRSVVAAPSPSPTTPARILVELRPALDGFAGIPQETRLLYRGLRMIEGATVEGMLQTAGRKLARGTSESDLRGSRQRSHAWRINRYSRVIVSMAEKPYRTLMDRVADYAAQKVESSVLTGRSLMGWGMPLSRFETANFADFVWRTLFSKTLPASDFNLVTQANLKICTVPWSLMHRVGLNSLNVLPLPRYPKLDTAGHDIFIAQTPYPARIHPKTALVVRYHDAMPVLMPHTIPDKSIHQASHFYALTENVRAGAYFACISDATRADLLRMFPEAADRAVTIHNMVSHHYFHEDSPKERVADVIRSRLYEEVEYEGVKLRPEFFTLREKESFYKRCLGGSDLRYLLMVSTIEPRKNHARLLAAWEVLKAEVDPSLKLVVVGTLGWDYTRLTSSLRTWIDRGDVFMLNAVPAPDLRLLYRHARATVCPSLGEGFDYSGVEAMASGGLTVASDIPVHQEIYEDAAEYFNPYSTASLVGALTRVLYAEDASAVAGRMRQAGARIADRYKPETILPEWRRFLNRVIAEKRK